MSQFSQDQVQEFSGSSMQNSAYRRDQNSLITVINSNVNQTLSKYDADSKLEIQDDAKLSSINENNSTDENSQADNQQSNTQNLSSQNLLQQNQIQNQNGTRKIKTCLEKGSNYPWEFINKKSQTISHSFKTITIIFQTGKKEISKEDHRIVNGTPYEIKQQIDPNYQIKAVTVNNEVSLNREKDWNYYDIEKLEQIFNKPVNRLVYYV